MDAPPCPHCGEPLDRVVDVPYGYWEFDGERYQLRTTADTVELSPFACARCLRALGEFHPQDAVRAP